MSTAVVTFEEAVNLMIDHALHNMYTSMPARVVAVRDSDKQSVDVQPLLSSLYDDETVVERPTILNVQLMFPMTQTSMLKLAVKVGDPVLLVFSQRGLTNFKNGDGTPAPPSDHRIFSRQDAIAIPGCFPFALVPQPTINVGASEMALVHNIGTSREVALVMGEDGSIKLIAPSTARIDVSCGIANVTATTAIGLNAPTVSINGTPV